MRNDTALLLDWYEKNRRRLPWREEPTPYHVWISEIMLQQTRVEAVRPYYARFLAALPDIGALADVPEDALMKLWEGLGYYSRARNLKRAAQALVRDHGGRMPEEAAELEKLPGIGSYTAGAIASIAFGKRVPAVDGNALRIWTRKRADARDIMKETTKRAIRGEIADVLPEEPYGAGCFNQALMDLGATICLPNRVPKCAACPWERCCLAHADGRETDFPVAAKKKPRRVEKRTIFLIEDDGRVFIRRRPEKGLLAGLYELPGAEGHLTKKEVLDFCAERGIRALRITPLPAAKHIFTHIEWHMIGYRIRVDELSDFFPDQMRAVLADKQEISTRYSIPSAFSDYILYIT